MIVPAITEYLDSTGEDVAPDTVERFLPRLIRTFNRNLGVKEGPRRRPISASLPWYCPRRCLYDITGQPGEATTGRSRMTFLLGDVYQVATDIAAEQAGVTFAYPDESGEELELEWEVDGHKVVAHIDHAIKVEGEGLVAVDSKSMSDYSFQRARKAAVDASADWWERERWGIVAQLRFYAWGLKVLGLGTGKRSIIVGVNKNTGHLVQIEVPECPDTIAVFERAIPLLANARDAWDAHKAEHPDAVLDEASGFLLPRPGWANAIRLKGNNKRPDGTKGPVWEVDQDKERTGDQGWRCGYCKWNTGEGVDGHPGCWEGFRAIVVSGKPKLRKPAE